MARGGIVRDFWLFLKTEKKWWLLPLVILLVGIGVLIVFLESSALAPFIYPFF
jgi:uncharacterized protein DUF5989